MTLKSELMCKFVAVNFVPIWLNRWRSWNSSSTDGSLLTNLHWLEAFGDGSRSQVSRKAQDFLCFFLFFWPIGMCLCFVCKSVGRLNGTCRADWRAACWDRQAGPRTAGHGRQDEDTGGAAPGLPATHCRPQGKSLRKRRTLQHAANWCESSTPSAG